MDINIININDFDIKQITYSKSFFIGQNKKKISIGYGDKTDFHLVTPFLTNTMDFLLNHKYQYLKMIFDPMLGDILKFYNIILSIENSIKNQILKNNKLFTLQSIIRNDQTDIFIDDEEHNIELNSIKNIFLKLTSNFKSEPSYKIYDTNSVECSLNNLKNGWKYKGLIKIDSIWIDTIKKKFGLNLELVQLKILQPIVQTKCLIDNDVLIIKKDIYKYSNNTLNVDQDIKVSIPYPSNSNLGQDLQSHPQLNMSNKTSNNIDIKTSFIPPNAKDLLTMKSALKRVL
jgi:hypothetical protein